MIEFHGIFLIAELHVIHLSYVNRIVQASWCVDIE